VTTTAGTTMTPGVSCGSGQMNCGGTCVSRHDPGNCGTCGNACGAGKDCFWSTAADGSLFDIHCDCLAGSGLMLCGDRCRNVQADAENCGACGNICPIDQACTAGICRAPGCPGGQTRCSGICTDLLSDSAHCGTCGNTCGIGTTCTAGACIPTCPTGTSYCGGSCRNLQTDALNCGSCGNSCPTGLVCSGGACLASSPGGSFSMTCLVGYTDCGSGCTDLRTDVTNCGSCGTVCSTGEGCYSGSCSHCPYGYYDCGSGCSYLPADSLNCGYCGNACPSGQSCSGGVCTLFCNKGMTACPGAKGGPACVDLQTDSSNCGSCGNVCTTGSCSGGACGFILR
jgi:hypothetical protein